ncbi:MAG TPA: CcoQ/FixQ family Cbb3-type cytochrome c oxidase assembly chaperone [Acetobacteraceae bacterium]|nr:CcoQ/FixQ family Cbb3-type cytochrome c oxidase assembly chaperone [Acetobacteraceae bacterium]
MDTLIALYPVFRAIWVVWFFLLFVGLVLWVMRPSAKGRYAAMARLPLNDDPRATPR